MTLSIILIPEAAILHLNSSECFLWGVSLGKAFPPNSHQCNSLNYIHPLAAIPTKISVLCQLTILFCFCIVLFFHQYLHKHHHCHVSMCGHKILISLLGTRLGKARSRGQLASTEDHSNVTICIKCVLSVILLLSNLEKHANKMHT